MKVISTELFTDRAKNYANYRPSYSEQALNVLRKAVPTPGIAADVGAGTGIFSLQLLESGYQVLAVEPNDAMREETQATCGHHQEFKCVKGCSEATGLQPESVDLITAAQAFHWFDRPKAKQEFQRIAKPGGVMAVVWNTRKFESSDFMRAYKQALLNFAPKYQQMVVHWQNLEDNVKDFLAVTERERHAFPNIQMVDLNTFIGNLESTSYIPKSDEPLHTEIMAEMRNIFEKYQENGHVEFVLDTILYLNHIRL
jgi:ubiquinone/menaquinone biosynthesis C-methylase UbiE